MAFGSIVILGAVRNCSDYLLTNFEKLSASFSPLFSISWFLVESDSQDDTVDILQGLERSSTNFHFRSFGNLRDSISSRTERIAFCRNAYLGELRSAFRFQNIAYVAVADFDEVNSLISKEAVSSCFDKSDWDICAANQIGAYYDIWALRQRDWCPGDCWRMYRFLVQQGVKQEYALYAAVYSKMIEISPQSPWIEVDSAFGGLAIYRKDLLDFGYYTGRYPDGSELCEHVPFHRQLKEAGGRMFINPRLINSSFNVHNEHVRQLLMSTRSG